MTHFAAKEWVVGHIKKIKTVSIYVSQLVDFPFYISMEMGLGREMVLPLSGPSVMEYGCAIIHVRKKNIFSVFIEKEKIQCAFIIDAYTFFVFWWDECFKAFWHHVEKQAQLPSPFVPCVEKPVDLQSEMRK